MNENSLKNLKPVKKGQVLNPKGRPPSVLSNKMRQLTAEEFAEIANLIVKGSVDELAVIAKDKTQSALRVMIASVAIKAINKGDMGTLDTLLNRMVGKVKEKIEITGKDSGPIETTTEDSASRKARIAEKLKKIQTLNGK